MTAIISLQLGFRNKNEKVRLSTNEASVRFKLYSRSNILLLDETTVNGRYDILIPNNDEYTIIMENTSAINFLPKVEEITDNK